ncbi:hypothetical protein KC365_g18760, partial [Hortaea werneckii]
MVANPAHHQLEARQGPCDYWGEDSDQCKGFKAYTSSTGNAVQQSNTATAATTSSTTASDDDTGDDNHAATSITTSLALGGTTATLSGTQSNNAQATATKTIVSSDDSSNTIATTSPSTLETSITSFSDVTSTGPQTIVGGGLGSDLASSTTASSPTASGLSLQQKQSDDGMSSGAVAAAIVVPLLFALLALILAVLCLRRRRRRRNHHNSTTTSHTHFLTPMREKFSRSSPRNSLPPIASLPTGPPILTSPHNNTYNTGLDTPSGTSHRGQSDEYYAVLPPRRSEGGTFIDPPPPYKPSSLASASSAHSAEGGGGGGGGAPTHRERTAYPAHPNILAPPAPTAAALTHPRDSHRDSSHRGNRWSLGPFTDLAATNSRPNDNDEEEDSRPSTAATASTFRAHPVSSSGGSGRRGSGSGGSWTSSNHYPGMREGTGRGGLSPYDIPSRNGQGMVPGGGTGAEANEGRSPTPRSFSSEMYSDTASVHSARAGLVRDGGPRVLGSSRSGHDARVRMREGDPFGDPRRSQTFGDDETEGEEWHSLTGSGGGRSDEGS